MARAKIGIFSSGSAVGACALVLLGCGQTGSDPPRKMELSGPAGLEHSVHPHFAGDGRMVVPGCCSLALGAATVRRLEGDVDGRQVEGSGYMAILSFGNRLGRKSPPGGSTTVQVDGVTLRKTVLATSREGEPRLLYSAIVPLDDKAQRRNIASPGLDVTGWCSSRAACDELTQVLDSLRF